MKKERNKIEINDYVKNSVIRICKLIHILLTLFLFMACLHIYNSKYNNFAVGNTRFMIFVFLYMLILCFSLRTYKSYDFGLTGSAMLIYSQTLSNIISGGIFYVVFVIANSTLFTPLPLICLIAAQLLLNILWSCAINKLYFYINKPKKAVAFYKGRTELLRLRDIIENSKTFSVTKTVEVSGEDFDSLSSELDDCEVVFAAGLSSSMRNKLLEHCVENDIQCYTVPVIGDIIMMGATYMDMFSIPVFRAQRANLKIEYAFIKRAIDIVCSLAGIIVLSPVMLITALAIRFYDGGPAFYKQIRLTKNGRKFEILKFRSMRVNAESDGVARLASDNDDRITPIGKIIRACRIDELPQLFNILKGDMTIVGPRPERPEIAAQYEEEFPSFDLRLQVRAGLTGLAQVYGRYNTEPYDKLQMDLMYINHMSLTQDLKLIFATVKILFIKDSTQGTAEGQLTAMTHTDDESADKIEREVAAK